MDRNSKIALGIGGGLVVFSAAVLLWRRSAAAASSPMMQPHAPQPNAPQPSGGQAPGTTENTSGQADVGGGAVDVAADVVALSSPTPLRYLDGKLVLGDISAVQNQTVRNGYFDIQMSGGWVLLDATGLAAQGLNARNLGAGDVATVIIRNDPNATPQVAHIEIRTNVTPNPMWTFLHGQWLDGPFAYQSIDLTQLNVWKINE